MIEQQLDKGLLGKNSVEAQTPGTSLLDLSPLLDRKNFHQTIGFLNNFREQFERAGWRGGIKSDNGRYTIDDIKQLVVDINQGNISPLLVSANEQLAFAQAVKFAGAAVLDRLLARLSERAQREEIMAHKSKDKIPLRPKSLSRWVWKLTVAAPPAVAALSFVAASKPWENFQSTNDYLLQNNSELGVQVADSSFDDSLQDDGIRQNGISDFFAKVGEKVESATLKTPNVEELESSVEDFNLWDFDLNDPENPITISWNSPEVVTDNNQEPLQITVSPIEKSVGNRLSRVCYTTSDMECSIAFDNFIVAQVHSSLNGGRELAMERARGYLEGGTELTGIETRKVNFTSLLTPENREKRRLLLERDRATLAQGDHEAEAQVAIVRIEEKYVWPNLYNDLGTVVEAALRVDPVLSLRINLERPFAVFFTCGWRLTGDELSSENINWYSSSMYLFFVGEASGS